MAIPNVDTFEHDISEEIRVKEATITDIAAASGDVGNTPTPHANTSRLLFILAGIFMLAIIGIFIALYISVVKKASTGEVIPVATTPEINNKLLAFSPILNDALAGNIGTVQRSEYGYTLQVLGYTNVYAYMLKNESVYADELALAVSSPRETGTSSLPFTFTDVTLNNQNMRVGTSGSSTLIYGFVNTNALVVSSSTEGILALRGILR